MSKIKSNRGAAKRFKARANYIKRKQSFLRHILTKKSTKRKRALRPKLAVHKSDVASIKRMLPNL